MFAQQTSQKVFNWFICTKVTSYKIHTPGTNSSILHIHSALGDYVAINETGKEDPNLIVFITHREPPIGGGPFDVGIAWGGTVCVKDDANVNGGTNNGKTVRINISSWVFSDLQLSEVKENILY